MRDSSFLSHCRMIATLVGPFPAGVVFPVAAAILEKIDDYRSTLEEYSKRLLPVIDWEPTRDGNVHVKNDTADFYGFFDETPHAEFLYACVKKTIEEDVPRETALTSSAHALSRSSTCRIARSIYFFGSCTRITANFPSVPAPEEFAEMTDAEASAAEAAYAVLFGKPE